MKQQHWVAACIKDDKGKPISVVANAIEAIKGDAGMRDALAFDEMLCLPMLLLQVGVPINGDVLEPRPLTDKDFTEIQCWLQHAGLARIARETTRDAVLACALDHSYHPHAHL